MQRRRSLVTSPAGHAGVDERKGSTPWWETPWPFLFVRRQIFLGFIQSRRRRDADGALTGINSAFDG